MKRIVEVSDGRKLCVAEGGAPDGKPVVYHMGTPTSRLVFSLHDGAAKVHGVRLISYDRPGYGGSTPRPGRTVADSADDVEAIADALGLERVGLWGFSGGPPFGFAAAARMPDRITGVVSLASPAPGLYTFDESEDFDAERRQMLAETADDWRARLKPEYAAFAEYAVATLRIALANSAEGWREDEQAVGGDWGFDVASIRAPVRLRHGRADKAVPVEHGEWLAAHVPGVDAHFGGDDDHQAVHFRYLDDDFGWLASL